MCSDPIWTMDTGRGCTLGSSMPRKGAILFLSSNINRCTPLTAFSPGSSNLWSNTEEGFYTYSRKNMPGTGETILSKKKKMLSPTSIFCYQIIRRARSATESRRLFEVSLQATMLRARSSTAKYVQASPSRRFTGVVFTARGDALCEELHSTKHMQVPTSR